MTDSRLPALPRAAWLTATACAAALLCACGGGGSTDTAQAVEAASDVPAVATLAVTHEDSGLPEAIALQQATPAFHAAPVLLDEPDDADTSEPDTSARRGPHQQALPAGAGGLSTRGLTVQALEDAARSHALSTTAGEGRATPLAAGSTVTTYTPAQVRAAYGLPALPAAGVKPTAAQIAQLGGGQTLYIVNAHHNPNVAAELAAFNQKFGLPTCTTKVIAATAALPLAAVAPAACELSVVYATASGTMKTAAPAYDAGWATEIALDVQWAHATAPLARIVLIEAVDASLNSLLGAIKLANAMGPGVVSMSFGATEGNWTASVDAAFTTARMTYLAATGDNGASVSWPSVSTNVLAVGGTTLSYGGGGNRSEVAWSGTGGGTSAYTATPAFQKNTVPGMGAVARRTVADVAFNADPSTGQYTAVMKPGSAAVNWLSVGGTSLSTPQWAGLLAIANALRAQGAKAALGAPHVLLYGPIASTPGTYAGAFTDVTRGSHGSCTSCTARIGYDPLTGLGTPNATPMLGALAGATIVPGAPVVTATTVSTPAGTAWSFQVPASGGGTLSWSLANAPTGMAISTNGMLSWAKPVAGTHAVTVTARDKSTGLAGSAVVTVQVTATGPTITAAAITGVAGKALTGKITISAPGASSVRISVAGVPAGMGFTMSGLTITASWPAPKAGSYTLKITAVDNAGRTATAAVPVAISAK